MYVCVIYIEDNDVENKTRDKRNKSSCYIIYLGIRKNKKNKSPRKNNKCARASKIRIADIDLTPVARR
jgi:hypothetical protein